MSRLSGASALLSLALGLSLFAVPMTAEVAAADPVVAPVPVLAWATCDDDEGPSDAQCATAAVPLDYDTPTGTTVDLDLLRVPATGDPADKLGTLFVNPGGPGGSARFFAYFFGSLVPAEVSAKFDIVGIDPRGVGPSAPMICRTSEKRPRGSNAFFPMTKREVRDRIAYDKWQRRACRDGGNRIVDHMTTADTARDMDLIRQAVGDDQLTYYGVSYGTQLGATYAAMFPEQVRAMIVDGVLDPVEWSTGHSGDANRPFSERLGSGYGAWQSMTSALAECDRVGKKRCPIAGHAPEIWHDIVHKLRRGGKNRSGITYADVIGRALGSLYDPRGIRSMMRGLKHLHKELFGGGRGRARAWDPRTIARVTDRPGIPGPYAWTTPPTPSQAGYGRVWDPFAGVACADSDNPADSRAWVKAAKRADRRSPWFGSAWTWASSSCAGWPSSTKADRFSGPYRVTTDSPVLVVGNTYDPATPLHGARALNRMLDGSRLLVLDGWGHGAIGSGPCIKRAYGAYLVDGTLPRAGTVCKSKQELFPRRH